MNKCQKIQVHEKPGIVADIITKDAGSGRLRQDQPGYTSGFCPPKFLNQKPEA
jgi:hypothetical protein